MASFLSQLVTEYNNHKDVVDQHAIKTLRFENEPNVTHQILGPIFKDTASSSIMTLFEKYCLVSLRQGFDWSKWDSAKPQTAWPLTNTAWVAWVGRMETFFSQEWKALGIYNVVWLSTMEMAMDKELLMAALSIWCSATNTMIFPLGPVGPTILDISVIHGTSPSGVPVDAALFGCSTNLDLKSLFDERAVEALSKEGREPSKEENQKLHKNFFNYKNCIIITIHHLLSSITRPGITHS